MKKQVKNTLSPAELLAVVQHHKRPMLWTFVGVMAVAALVTLLGPRSYTSEAKIFVRLGRESASMDPTATMRNVVMVQESREYEINSVFEMLRSREIMTNVVREFGSQIVLEKSSDTDGAQTAGLFSFIPALGPYSFDDEAIKHLSKHLTVSAVKKSNVINIFYEANNPDLARAIVQSVIDQARETHQRINRTIGSQEFLEGQVVHLRDKLVLLESQLRDHKNLTGVASLLDQRVLKLQQISDLETSLLRTEAALKASIAEMEAQETTLKSLPETITTEQVTGMPQSAVAALREELFRVQVREKEALSVYTPVHPVAVAIRDQVEKLQAIHHDEPNEPQITSGLSKTHQELHAAYLKNVATTASMRALVATLGQQLAAAREELSDLNNNEVEVARLEREIEMDRRNYRDYADSLEQARIDHELESTNISNLNVLQPPSYSITPTKPKRTLNMALGLMAAMVASMGVGLLLEQRRKQAMS